MQGKERDIFEGHALLICSDLINYMNSLSLSLGTTIKFDLLER
jgi:hypothetical protein